jgi:DNA modification methylase
VAKSWNGPGSLTHWAAKSLRGEDKYAAEKPLDLMLEIVSYLSDPGESIVDPFGGVGTTALACRLLGRSCVAFEDLPDVAERARVRVAGPLSPRDLERAERYVELVSAEAVSVPAPRAANGSDVRTYERAQRRFEDVARVAGAL